ncbi:MAG: family 16 glycosylhydrolase [Ignavibacteriales bacterium]|nr:MAG: family 16 glycosylhydrolase [Ignavibacteriales bacterium]
MNKPRLYITVFLLLAMAAPLAAKDFKGAELRTKQSFLYGRFEVNMKAAGREGMLSSFFTYNDNSTGPDTWNEIDIEILGRYNDNVQFNTITPGQANHVRSHPVNYSPHLEYRTYAFEWTPSYVAWFIDGVEVYRQTSAHIQTLNKTQKIMMNIWNPSFANWVGQWSPDILPAFAYYDWVKYYTYTPGTGNYGSGNNFTFSWGDEFDYFNTSRWEKGTHTWFGNGCDFVVENAVFRDSKLILCLTDQFNLGYTDITPPKFIGAKVQNNKVIASFTEELDSVTAQTESNFIIVGATVDNAQIRPDNKSVELTVSGWDFVSSKNLLVFNVKDRFNNTAAARAITISPQTQFTFPVKINAAGPAALGYLADAEWNLTTDYGYYEGGVTTYASSLQINGTDEDEIYRTERYGAMGYKVRLPNGTYRVKMMFAENYLTAAGKRIFDIYLEQNRVLQNLDIYASVGGNTALVHTFDGVSVQDGVLDIYFGAQVDMPLINGIIIEQDPSGTDEGSLETPGGFRLHQNYPNPFNGQTVISFSVHTPGDFIFSVYNTLGESLFEKHFGFLEQGEYSISLRSDNLNRSSASSGVYFYELASAGARSIKKLLLLN